MHNRLKIQFNLFRVKWSNQRKIMKRKGSKEIQTSNLNQMRIQALMKNLDREMKKKKMVMIQMIQTD